jgi:hypothetical protein
MTVEAELPDFLQRADRLRDPALIYGAGVDAEAVLGTMERLYAPRPILTLRATGLIEPTDEEITESFRNSFEAHGVLAVLIGERVPKPLARLLERVVKDGRMPDPRAATPQDLQPPAEWRVVAIARLPQTTALPHDFLELFPAVLAVG